MAHQSVWNNPKIQRIARALKEPLVHVVGHLESFWVASYEHCLPDGKVKLEDVEIMARWDGKPGHFVKTLQTQKAIVRRGRAYYIKSWKDHIPEYVRKRIRRMELRRSGMSGQRPDVVRTTADAVRLPNQTKDNDMIPDASVDNLLKTSTRRGTPEWYFGIPEIEKKLVAGGFRSPDSIRSVVSAAKVTAKVAIEFGVQFGLTPPRHGKIRNPPGYLVDIIKKEKAKGLKALAAESAIEFVRAAVKKRDRENP